MFWRMATDGYKRILVYLKKSGSSESPVPAKFSQSILTFFGFSDHTGQLSVQLEDNKLILTNSDSSSSVKIKRPPFCPIHKLTQSDIDRLPEATLNRGVDVGAAVILHTADNKILLTRRASHLRTFPGIWVPPGGHIEENETILQAAFRELTEETGLSLGVSDCADGDAPVLALWESTFPQKLSLGLPKRHHIVVYLVAKLIPSLTSEVLQKQIALDPEEVGASVWLDRQMVDAITSDADHNATPKMAHKDVPSLIEAIVVDEFSRNQEMSMLPTAPLLETRSDAADMERVSTGTKFALQEWLKVT